jgi:hypothetical protein
VDLGPDGIVVPAEVLGTLTHRMPSQRPGALIIAGGVNSYVAQQWLAKGALAATTDEAFADSLVDGNLGWLRDRPDLTEGRAARAGPPDVATLLEAGVRR